jgi:hypothetical protein
MGVDFTAIHVVGYRVNIPSDIIDPYDYMENLCRKVGFAFCCVGNSYLRGHMDFYIVPKEKYDSVDGMKDAISRLPLISEVLTKEGVNFVQTPTIGAFELVW